MRKRFNSQVFRLERNNGRRLIVLVQQYGRRDVPQLFLESLLGTPRSAIRKLKQQRRRWLRKRHLKSEFALLQTLSCLFHLVYFVKRRQSFLELNSKGLYQSSRKEKESCCLVLPSSTKCEIRHFHVVVVQRRLRNVQKSVMYVQLLFC